MNPQRKPSVSELFLYGAPRCRMCRIIADVTIVNLFCSLSSCECPLCISSTIIFGFFHAPGPSWPHAAGGTASRTCRCCAPRGATPRLALPCRALAADDEHRARRRPPPRPCHPPFSRGGRSTRTLVSTGHRSATTPNRAASAQSNTPVTNCRF
jgi:hypothetical protein